MRNNVTDTLYQILIISDGELNDLQKVLDYADKINATDLRNHILQTAAIRIGTQGDTKALTCFFKIHNHSIEQQLIDITHNNPSWAWAP